MSVATDDVSITLSWSAPETGRVAGYHVSYGTADSEERQSVNSGAEQTTFSTHRFRRALEYELCGLQLARG